MNKIHFADYCCQGGNKAIDRKHFGESELIIAREGNRELIFSPLGNRPQSPKLALVGITPGGQSEEFAKFLRQNDVEVAARMAAFARAHKAIGELLLAHGFLDALGIQCPADMNKSDEIFTTSLVKCCLKVNGSYRYAAPDILSSRVASYCVSNRFIGDIESYGTIRHIVIFGDPGWDAVNLIHHKGLSVKAYLEKSNIVFIKMPHFAQNFQQRSIYVCDPTNDDQYFKEKPSHRPYFAKAAYMRQKTIDHVRMLRS